MASSDDDDYNYIPVSALQQLYKMSSTNGKKLPGFITFPVEKREFPPVKRLDPLHKKRILVTGVSLLFIPLITC